MRDGDSEEEEEEEVEEEEGPAMCLWVIFGRTWHME